MSDDPPAPSVREAALLALLAALAGALPQARTLRNAARPERVPSGGIAILRDGDPGPAEQTYGVPSWAYEHEAEIELAVMADDDADRHARLDAMLQALGAALTADPTLGGAVEWCEALAPAPDDVAADGAATLRTAIVPVLLLYVTDTPI